MTTAPRALVLAHRGLRRSHRENTLAAFDAALAAGCDGVELDVRRLGDDTLVLHHDAKLASRGRRPLARLKASDLRPSASDGPTIDRLSAAMRWARRHPRAWLDVEIKEAGFEARVLRAVLGARKARRVLVSSFLPQACAAAVRVARGIPVGLITLRRGEKPVRLARDLGVQALVLHERNATQAAVRAARARDLQVWTWGVETASSLQRLVRCGVEAVITDHPDRLLGRRRAGAVRAPRR